MKTQVSSLSVFGRAGGAFALGKALAVGLLLLVAAFNNSALAEDGPKAAAAAKEAAANMQAYLRDLEKSKGQPDYSKPPASEYLKRIFDTDALAALPAPKAEDLDWLLEWVANINQAHTAMILFGAKDLTDHETLGRNTVDYQDYTFPAAAFRLRLVARMVPIYLNSFTPDERIRARTEIEQDVRLFVQMATSMVGLIRIRVKLENVRLTAAALHDTAAVWAPLATQKERAELLTRLETVRTANKDAGIDDDITAISTAIKNVKE
jgi:hypothetical protein